MNKKLNHVDKIVVVSDSHFQCPHCGETYIQHNWWRYHGELVSMTCAGEDGCGQEFWVEYNDPDHEINDSE